MTPKEKAKELTDKFYEASCITVAGAGTIFKQNAKNLSLIAVDEILDQANKILLPRKYWEDVKTEISKL